VQDEDESILSAIIMGQYHLGGWESHWELTFCPREVKLAPSVAFIANWAELPTPLLSERSLFP